LVKSIVGSRWTFANVLCTQFVPNPDLGLVNHLYQDQLPPTCKWHDSAGTPAAWDPLSRSQTPCQITELARGAITAIDTLTIEPRRGRRNPGDRHRRMACQGNRLSPLPFRLARILLPVSSPPPSWSRRGFDGSNGSEPDH